MNFKMTDANELINEVYKQTEKLLLDQLNDFVSRGLIVIESGPMSLVKDSFTDEIRLNQIVKLVLKDKEYITKLEKDKASLEYELKILLGIKDRLSK